MEGQVRSEAPFCVGNLIGTQIWKPIFVLGSPVKKYVKSGMASMRQEIRLQIIRKRSPVTICFSSETRNKFMSRTSNQTHWYLGEDISEVQGSFGPMESELDVLQMVVKIKCQGI